MLGKNEGLKFAAILLVLGICMVINSSAYFADVLVKDSMVLIDYILYLTSSILLFAGVFLQVLALYNIAKLTKPTKGEEECR